MSGSQTYPMGDFNENLYSKPGVNRDDTRLDSDCFSDSQHMRFHNGQPRKIGGYEKIFQGNDFIVRAMHAVSIEDFTRVFLFRDSGVSQIDILANGAVSGEIDRTPVGWVSPSVGEPSLTFSYDQMTVVSQSGSTVISQNFLIFVAPPNSENPNQTTEAPIYLGDITLNTPFLPIGQSTSGGIIVSIPYLIKYGNNGILYYSAPGNPFVWTTTTTSPPPGVTTINYSGISSEKLLIAKRSQGGMLFWTATQLIRVVFNTQLNTFVGAPTSPGISMLSPSSLVECHDNSFVWVGNQNWYIYNGVSNTITNTFNQIQFFNNLNEDYRGKIWGMYMGKFEEIWWFNVEDGATEANRAYIYKYKDNTWSDTYLARSCGQQAGYYFYPLMASSTVNEYTPGENRYSVWAHEKGMNIVNDGVSYPLQAWIQTKLFSLFSKNPQINVEMKITKIERDMNMNKGVTLNLITYDYPYSEAYVSQNYVLEDTQHQYNVSLSGRYVSFKYTTNDIDGFMQIGKNMYNYQFGPQRASS